MAADALNPYVRIEIEDALKCLDSADAKHIAYHLNGALAALGEQPADQSRHILNIGHVVQMQVVAMQAALIEWKHGRGARAAMLWIENTLDGPGLIPDDDAGTEAQAFFDREAEKERERVRRAEADFPC